MTADLSFFHLIKEASIIVQLVMLILLLASVVAWTFIFEKQRELKSARIDSDNFEKRFWSGIDLADLYKQLSAYHYQSEGIEKIFLAGYKEFTRAENQPEMPSKILVDASERAMRIALSREMGVLDNRLPFLATVGSTSPYVGLFGTVWGIMNSFRSLGNVKQATLALVAPGIAEALVATAMGLFAAIPAVIAYNRYANQIEQLSNRYEVFIDEFIGLLERQAYKPQE